MSYQCVICEEPALHTVDCSPVCDHCESLLTSHNTSDIIERFRIIETYNLRRFGPPLALLARYSLLSVLLVLAMLVITLCLDGAKLTDTEKTRSMLYAAVAMPVAVTVIFGIIFAILRTLEEGEITVVVRDGILRVFHDTKRQPPRFWSTTLFNLKDSRVFWGRPGQFWSPWASTRYAHAMQFRISELSSRRFRCFVVCRREGLFKFGELRALVGLSPASRSRWRFF